MLNVFLTIDTELWPMIASWPKRPLAAGKVDFSDEIATEIYGKTKQGEFGLPFQIATFNHYGLKASFFVEALFASRVGTASLADISRTVQTGGHDVQLHLHTEWLGDLSDPSLPRDHRQYLSEFSLAQQIILIRKGMHNLAAAGVARIHAFRAGSYGANLDTLRALARNGIPIDSSHNRAYLHGEWGRQRGLIQPAMLEGVWEFPVTGFRDYPGHHRHAQLCACSFAEMRNALLDAWQADWYAFVIVLHSFELVKHRQSAAHVAPDRLSIRRFEQLCAFLAMHKDKFRTMRFSEVDLQSIPVSRPLAPLRSRLADTARRIVEQGLNRLA